MSISFEVTFDELLDGITLRPTARGLIQRVFLDLPLTMAQRDDFGVESDDHYRAIRAVLMESRFDNDPHATQEQVMNEFAEKAEQLEAALGNGEKLNQLVKQYAPQYVGVVTFRTVWDELREMEAKRERTK